MKTIYQVTKPSFRTAMRSFLSLAIILSSLWAVAQPPLPEVTVRFANPVFDCLSGTYCLDVEFNTDTQNEELYGINVRFFFDNDVLSFKEFNDFQGGYGPANPNPPDLESLIPGGGQASYGFIGDGLLLNGAVQLGSDLNPIYISTTDWTKLFSVCFTVNPAYYNLMDFCPSIVWDLKADGDGGFGVGSDGVVITLVDVSRDFVSKPVKEQVVQFNWEYSDVPGIPFGSPVEEICISSDCPLIPLSNWALYTAIMLIFVFLLVKFRRVF